MDRTLMKHSLLFPLLLSALLLLPARMFAQEYAGDREFFDPVSLMLTWQSDPTTTMTVDWHVIDEDRTYMEVRRMGASSWSDPLQAEAIDFPWSNRTVHRVEVTGLEPGTRYEFRFGQSSKIYNFRTMPADLTNPVRIAVGGDTMHNQAWMEQTSRQAMKYDLDFILIGGDLSYADALPPEEQRQRNPYAPRLENQWYGWLEAYKNSLITDDYRVVPVVASIGNHEVRGGYYYRDQGRPDHLHYRDSDEWRAEAAPYFFSLFAFPGLPGYGVLDFGDYLSILLLDSDHANPVTSQNGWLEQTLSERQHVRHVFPIYHVPAWPSVRNMNDRTHQAVRENWVPIFERFNLEVVFEAHDHAYKRTHPIRDGRISPNGVIYVGDGAWGTSTRRIGGNQDHDNWYIAEAASERHFILLTLHGTQRHMLMVNDQGEVIDELPAVYGR